jgi:hypothetical protein
MTFRVKMLQTTLTHKRQFQKNTLKELVLNQKHKQVGIPNLLAAKLIF